MTKHPPEPPPCGHLNGMVRVLLTVTVSSPCPPLTNLKLYPPEIQSPGRIRRCPSMLDGPISSDLPEGGGPPPQVWVDGKVKVSEVPLSGLPLKVRLALLLLKETEAAH